MACLRLLGPLAEIYRQAFCRTLIPNRNPPQRIAKHMPASTITGIKRNNHRVRLKSFLAIKLLKVPAIHQPGVCILERFQAATARTTESTLTATTCRQCVTKQILWFIDSIFWRFLLKRPPQQRSAPKRREEYGRKHSIRPPHGREKWSQIAPIISP